MKIRLLYAYILKNKVFSLVALYAMLSIFLNIFFHIDISIPCIFKTVFHTECPGCGLTRACTSLVKLDVESAYHFNPLIFIVLPAGIFYVVKDYLKFVKKSVNRP